MQALDLLRPFRLRRLIFGDGGFGPAQDKNLPLGDSGGNRNALIHALRALPRICHEKIFTPIQPVEKQFLAFPVFGLLSCRPLTQASPSITSGRDEKKRFNASLAACWPRAIGSLIKSRSSMSIRSAISWPISAANPKAPAARPTMSSSIWPACRRPSRSARAGLVGNDDLGRVILEDCRRHGIDIRHLRSTPLAPTSYTDVMTENGSSHRTFFHHRGANALVGRRGPGFQKTSRRAFFISGYLLLLDALDAPDAEFGTKAAALLHAAQQAGMKTSVDVVSEDSDRFARIVTPALKYMDYCILNEIEAGKTTGFNIREADERAEHRFFAPCRRRAVAGRRARTGGHPFSRRRLYAAPARARISGSRR